MSALGHIVGAYRLIKDEPDQVEAAGPESFAYAPAVEDLFFAVYRRRVEKVLTDVVPGLREVGSVRAFDAFATTSQAWSPVR